MKVNVRTSLPDTLYHGTTKEFIQEFKKSRSLLDSRFWKPNKDFGWGFYLTNDYKQARNWSAENSNFDDNACVLQIKVNMVIFKQLEQDISQHIFLGPSYEWIEYILKHRINKSPGLQNDPCSTENPHADIVSGPMARGLVNKNCGLFAFEYRKAKEKDHPAEVDDVLSRLYKILMTGKNGNTLNASYLGNQIVICNPDINADLLILEGYWEMAPEGGWTYVELR
ncbi:DUF3990 domain-containing protein [Rossellomorea vietnamensis]|uniref:DUF3990 domain-containing protein n=1 Tax=Rossellomorea vietnamensis TaxID=218284 RepID=UPI003CF9AB5B